MVRAFKQAGYELVVFLDNAIPDEKLTTWYRRRCGRQAGSSNRSNSSNTAAMQQRLCNSASRGMLTCHLGDMGISFDCNVQEMPAVSCVVL